MQTFKFFFCLVLSELILRQTDKLSQTLQQPELSSVEAHEVAMKTLEKICTDEDFELFWKNVGIKKNVNIDELKHQKGLKLDLLRVSFQHLLKIIIVKYSSKHLILL